MKSIVILAFMAGVTLVAADAAQAQETRLWRVEAGQNLYFVERWGFQKDARLDIPIDVAASISSGCSSSLLSPDFDNIKRITFDYEPAHLETVFQIRLKNDGYCYNEREKRREITWTGGKLKLDLLPGFLFDHALPAIAVLPTTGETARIWIPLSLISLIQPISLHGAVTLESQWPPPDRPNLKRPSVALKNMVLETESALVRYRQSLPVNQPLTNCGWYETQNDQYVTVSREGQKSSIPITKIFPNGYPCEQQ